MQTHRPETSSVRPRLTRPRGHRSNDRTSHRPPRDAAEHSRSLPLRPDPGPHGLDGQGKDYGRRGKESSGETATAAGNKGPAKCTAGPAVADSMEPSLSQAVAPYWAISTHGFGVPRQPG